MKAKCPYCSKAISLPQATYTNVVKRTCRKCGTRWQIVIRPLACRVEGMKMHECDFAEIAATCIEVN
jgi:hypothetical protein